MRRASWNRRGADRPPEIDVAWGSRPSRWSALLVPLAFFLCTGFFSSATPLLTGPTLPLATPGIWFRSVEPHGEVVHSTYQRVDRNPFYSMFSMYRRESSELFEIRIAKIPGTAFHVLQKSVSPVDGEKGRFYYFLLKMDASALRVLEISCKHVDYRDRNEMLRFGDLTRADDVCDVPNAAALMNVFRYLAKQPAALHVMWGVERTYQPIDRSVAVAEDPVAFEKKAESLAGGSAEGRAYVERERKMDRYLDKQYCRTTGFCSFEDRLLAPK